MQPGGTVPGLRGWEEAEEWGLRRGDRRRAQTQPGGAGAGHCAAHHGDCSRMGAHCSGVLTLPGVTFLSEEAVQRPKDPPKVTCRLSSGSFQQGVLLKGPRGDLGLQAGGAPRVGG